VNRKITPEDLAAHKQLVEAVEENLLAHADFLKKGLGIPCLHKALPRVSARFWNLLRICAILMRRFRTSIFLCGQLIGKSFLMSLKLG